MSKTHKYTELIFFGLLWLFLLAFIIGVFRGCSNMLDENNAIHSECKKTSLVVIGNKGHASQVYDCTGVDR